MLRYIQAPWKKLQKKPHTCLGKRNLNVSGCLKLFNKKHQAYGLNVDSHDSLEAPHSRWHLYLWTLLRRKAFSSFQNSFHKWRRNLSSSLRPSSRRKYSFSLHTRIEYPSIWIFFSWYDQKTECIPVPLGWKLACLSCKGILMSKRKAIAVFLQSVTTSASPLPPSPQGAPTAVQLHTRG